MSLSESKTKVLIVIPKELKEWIQIKAKQENRSMSNFLVHLIQMEHDKDQSEPK